MTNVGQLQILITLTLRPPSCTLTLEVVHDGGNFAGDGTSLAHNNIWEKGTNVLGNLGKNRGIPDYNLMDGQIVPMENYTFSERLGFPLSRNI